MSSTWLLWGGFNVAIAVLLTLDLGILHRGTRSVRPREAAGWTVAWIVLSLLFCAGIWRFWRPDGTVRALEFLTAYILEYSLSVDNLFVFLMIFSFFKVLPEFQHRLLFWGVLGAIIMRAALILLGTALVATFHWLLYVFGAFLLYTAFKMLFSGEEEAIDPEHSWVMRWARKAFPIARTGQGVRFVVREDEKWKVSPMFLILVFVEATDLLFALDSIPAVLGVSKDPFIIYSSNVCAILGLRSLFFVVASLMEKFHYLKIGLAVVLGFVGTKMLVERWLAVPIPVSLGIIFTVLTVSVLASWVKPPKKLP